MINNANCYSMKWSCSVFFDVSTNQIRSTLHCSISYGKDPKLKAKDKTKFTHATHQLGITRKPVDMVMGELHP